MVTFDGDLIYLYSENARIRLKDISNRLKKTPQRLKYSLSILEKEGIVLYPHCVFDYSYLGLLVFRVYFKGGYVGEADKASIIKQLNDNPYVIAIAEFTGEFDMSVEIAAPNPSRFNKVLKRLANLIPTLNNYKIILNVVTHIHPHQYLINSHEKTDGVAQEIIIGGDRAIESFDSSEIDVMKSLLLYPKMRLSSLAKASDLNVKTVASVVKRLEQRRIIKGFKHVIDTNRLGVQKFRLFLKLHNLSQDRELELRHFLLTTKEVVQVNKTVGDWDMEIDIESFDKKAIRALIMQLRDDFKDLIENFNITEFYQYHKKAYLPSYLFDEKSTEEKTPAETKVEKERQK
jgi:DNA-binding Lrp family transcriptional regulator